ncbi:MAG: hypothetical protein HZA90_20785 [Verrucomicrobia bacterium]|nr:hypothetical protein [Verrucomicrobiota bacterium]
MPETAAPCGPPRAASASPLLQAKLDALRRKHLNVAVGTGVARILCAVVLLLGTEMLLDYWLDLPWAARAVVLVATSAVACSLAVFRIVLPLLHQPDDDAMALMVEKERGQFRSRLIAAIQLTRPGAVPSGASSSLVGALVDETERLAAPLDFAAVVPTRELKNFGAWAAAVSLAGGIALFSGGQDARDLLRRAFLSTTPVPRKTRVFVADGDKIIGRGDSVVIEATARGVVPESGTLTIKSFIRRGQEFVMARVTNAANRFALPIENVQQSFDYVVRLNDGASPTHTVKVLPRPGLARLECEQTFPAYTGLPKRKRPLGDLTLLAGSRLHFAATATKKLKQASAKLDGLERTLPLSIAADNPKQLTGEIAIPTNGLAGFSIVMTDADSMESRDPTIYHVEIVPDKAPTVRITSPERKEELVTRQGVLLVGFDAVDDFQVAKARLRYRVGEGESAEVRTTELDLAGSEASRVQRRFEWKMAELTAALPYGTRVEFWAEVEDNNDVTGPGRGTSEHQLARIVTDDEKRADLLGRAGDFLGAVGDMATDQEKLNQNLGALILEKRK